MHSWDTLDGLHPVSRSDNDSSDSSSISEDVSRKPREPDWDPDTGQWKTYDDCNAWSDSNNTTEDMGRRLLHLENEAPIFVSQSYTPNTSSVNGAQAPTVQQKHPRPKYNERCRLWLRDKCELGYECNYVHEDLEYDDSLVGFDLLPYKHSFMQRF